MKQLQFERIQDAKSHGLLRMLNKREVKIDSHENGARLFVDKQKATLIPVATSFRAQIILVAFTLLWVVRACAVSTVDRAQRAVTHVAHPAWFTVTLHGRFGTSAMLARKPGKT